MGPHEQETDDEQRKIEFLIQNLPQFGAKLLMTFGLAHPLVFRFCHLVVRMNSPESAPDISEMEALWQEGTAALDNPEGIDPSLN